MSEAADKITNFISMGATVQLSFYDVMDILEFCMTYSKQNSSILHFSNDTSKSAKTFNNTFLELLRRTEAKFKTRVSRPTTCGKLKKNEIANHSDNLCER